MCFVHARATEYYLDASKGRMDALGTIADPLPSLEQVAASERVFLAGDELVLIDGHHGAPVLTARNPGPVTVRPYPGARATLRRLTLQSATNWRIAGLEISPSLGGGTFINSTIVTIAGGSDNVVEHCLLYSVPSIAGWSAADWTTYACNGISITGTRNIVRNNTLRHVRFGISAGNSGTYNIISRNVIDHFMSDGLRGLGDYCVFEYNIVKNVYGIDENHDDGFQSWSTGTDGAGTGVVRGVVLRGNWFLTFENPAEPNANNFQGIGCFDGFYEDWVVENNVVLTDHWHGMTFAGARNCRIVNNTVVDINSTSPGPCWIQIKAHKNGAPSQGNLVRNNLATDIRIDADAGVVDNNIVIPSFASYGQFFVNWAGFDMHLRPGASAIDAGTGQMAPSTDADDLPRPVDGNGDGNPVWDVGAYEYLALGTRPVAPTNLEARPRQ